MVFEGTVDSSSLDTIWDRKQGMGMAVEENICPTPFQRATPQDRTERNWLICFVRRYR